MEETRLRMHGDGLLDRYVPDADPETRERAREAFREFAGLLEALGEAVAQGPATDSHESDAGCKIQPSQL